MICIGLLLAIPFKSFAQCACTPTSAFPTTVNGITISLANTGSVQNYGANWPSCGLSAGPMWGGSAGPFTQTFTFSQPVNNVNYVITAASLESFSFNVGSGVLTTSQCGGTCPFTQVGNTFTANGNDDGTTIVLSSTLPYTSITVTSPGGGNGSLVGLCVESIVLCPTPTISIIPSAAICQGAARTLTVTGGTSYTWSPAGSLNTTSGGTVIATPGTTTTYTVVAAGSGTCTTSAVTTVSVTPGPTVSISPATANICSGSSVALTASGATTYSWIPATALSNTNTANVNASPGTTTTYTVIGANGTCTNSATRIVSVTPMPTLTLTPTFTTICAGSSTNLLATGATNYTWTPATGLNNPNLATVIASPATTTTYTITGANGICTSTAVATVSVVSLPTVAVTPATVGICSGSSTTLSATGATNYTWTPATGLNNPNLATVVASPATTTNYTITGASGICTRTTLATVSVTPMPTLTLTPTFTNICTGSSAILSASGATSYTWSPSASLSAATGSTVTATPAATTGYTVTGANAACTATALTTVSITPSPTVVINPASAGICIGGSVALTASGANSYNWTPSTGLSSANTASVMASPTVTTTYSITGANSFCTGLAFVTVSVTPLPTLTLTPTFTTICAGTSATLSATGATSYTWTPATGLNNANLATVIASPATTTTYTITGANGICTSTAVATVSVVPLPTVAVTPATVGICSGSSATLSATGATSYTWNPATGLNNANLATVTASPATTTTYTITGANGICTSTTLATVSVTPMPTLTLTPTFTTICAGSSANLAATGATNYTWTPATGLNNANLATVTASPATTTTYTITGANGVCTSTAIATVSVVMVPSLTLTPATASICAGSSNTLSATGASSYTWSPATGLNNANLATVVASPATTTTYTITGANGICTNTAVATVSVIAIPSLTVSPQTTTICAGTSATLTASGSTTYTWSPATGLNITNGGTVIASPAAMTVYNVASGVSTCTSAVTATVTINAVPSLTLNPASVNICPTNSVTLTAGGANTYTWSPAGSLNTSTGATVVSTPAASTSYTVTGTIGICTNTAVTTVNVLSSPTIAVSPQTSAICAGSSVTLTANGANTYTWSPATGLSTNTGSIVVSSPPVGTTVYTITGSIGTCTAVTQATVTVGAMPSLTLTPTTSSICAGTSGTLSAAGANTYTWAPTASITTGSVVTLGPLATTIYTVTGSIGTCTSSATTTLNVIANPTLNIVANTTVCAGNSANLTVSGASTYTWSPATGLSSTTGSAVTSSPAATQTYTITGTLNTCTAVASTTVTVVPRPTMIMGPDRTICSGSSATISASGATTYSWSPSTGLSSTTGGTVTASPASSTSYTVTGTTSGCNSTGSVSILVTPTPTLNVTASPSSMCRGLSSSLTASGAANYTWSPGGSLSDVNLATTTASPVQTTTYTVIGANGTCTTSATVELVVIQTATVQASKFGDVCFGESTTIEAIGGTTYNWQPLTGLASANAQSTNASPLVTTVYTVTASAPGLCASTSTVEVKVNPLPHVYAGRDTTINIDEAITLTGTGDVEVGFLSPTTTPLACNFCNAITVNPQEATCYVLKGENGYGCVDYDTVCVYVTKDFQVYIPNAFTPNEDGTNDVFIPMGYGIDEIRLTVFDRWGSQIFSSNETMIGWDGTNKGKPCEQGVYVYKAVIKTMAGQTIEKVGHVTLLPKSITR